MKKKIILFIAVMLCGMWIANLSGCGKKVEVEKVKDLTFEIVTVEQVTDELSQMIEQKKSEPFKFTYQEEGKLYVCIGYGKRESGGYSITVKDFFLAPNAIYVVTDLIGPDKEDAKIGGTSYPYIIIQTENIDKTVVFE